MHEQVRFFMPSPQLEYPILLPFMPRERLTVDRILAEIERVIQSNGAFKLDKSITVNIIHVEMPYGLRRDGKKVKNKYLTNTRTIVRIQNKDNICPSRATVVAKAVVDNDERPMLYSTGKQRKKHSSNAIGHGLSVSPTESNGFSVSKGSNWIKRIERISVTNGSACKFGQNKVDSKFKNIRALSEIKKTHIEFERYLFQFKCLHQ